MKDPQIVKDGIDPSDIKQGALGDCYFLSALSILAEYPDRVKRLFISTDAQLQKYGVFAVRVHIDGIPTEVVVDDYFPCLRGGGTAFSRSHGDELWVLLLEKMYAKVYGGYDKIEGGIPGDALADLTGAPYQFYKTQGASSVDSKELWNEMIAWEKQKFLMAASVPETPGVDLEKSLGLVQGHAYGILNVKFAQGIQLIQIRNPWGDSTEWKGDYSDDSKLWTESLKRDVGFVKSDDGTFWMKFDDFIKYFNDIVTIFYKDNWISSFFRFLLPRQAKTFFRMKIEQETSLRISFNQLRNATNVIHLRFTVSDANNKEVGTSGKALSSSEVISSNEMNLQPGTYVVTAVIYSKDVEKLPLELTITSYGNKAVHFDNHDD